MRMSLVAIKFETLKQYEGLTFGLQMQEYKPSNTKKKEKEIAGTIRASPVGVIFDK